MTIPGRTVLVVAAIACLCVSSLPAPPMAASARVAARAAARHTQGTSRARRPRFNYCGYRRATFTNTTRFLGVTDTNLLSSRRYADCTLGLMAADHVGYVRTELAWASVEFAPGRYDFTQYDWLVAMMAAHHIRWLPMLLIAPAFRSLAPTPSTPGVWAPRRAADVARFAAVVAARYGPGGSFWAAHPALPFYPVKAWQIWNEPDLLIYWRPKPNASAYVRVLRACSKAIKAVDPRAEIIAAGVPFYSLGSSAIAWYSAMYRRGGRGSFDSLAFHAYAPSAISAYQRIVQVRRLMDHYSDHRAGLWITEFGWSATGPKSPYRAGRQQPARIAGLLRLITRYRFGLGIRAAFYFSWLDAGKPPTAPDYWGLHTGLFARNRHPRPSLSTFVAAARALNR